MGIVGIVLCLVFTSSSVITPRCERVSLVQYSVNESGFGLAIEDPLVGRVGHLTFVRGEALTEFHTSTKRGGFLRDLESVEYLGSKESGVLIIVDKGENRRALRSRCIGTLKFELWQDLVRYTSGWKSKDVLKTKIVKRTAASGDGG